MTENRAQSLSKSRHDLPVGSVCSVRALPAALILALSLVVGCTAPGDAPGSSLGDLPMLSPVEEVRIGSFDDPDAGFSGIADVAVDEDRNVYVVESLDLEIRVYDEAGSRVGAFGRRGEGPGEFRDAPEIWIVRDTLWALARRRSAQLSLFTLNGDLVSTSRIFDEVRFPLQGDRADGIVQPRLVRSDGTLVGELTVAAGRQDATVAAPAETDTAWMPRVRFDRTGAVVDTLGFEPFPPPTEAPPDYAEIGGRVYRVPMPISDDELRVLLVDGSVRVVRKAPTVPGEATFRVVRLDMNRDTLHALEMRYEAQRYAEAYLETAALREANRPMNAEVARLLTDLTVTVPGPPENPESVARELRTRMGVPEFQPPIQRLESGNDGSVWLLRSSDGSAQNHYIVLAPDLEPVGQVALPASARLAWLTVDEIYLVETDDFDVPWLVRYGLVRAN